MTISTLDPSKAAPLEPDDGVFVFPASYAQQRLWFLDQLAPGSPVYNLPFAWRLRGPLDEVALEWALADILARHEPLRTTFALEEQEPVQVVSPPGSAALSLTRVDVSDLPAEQRETAARRVAREEALRPFDLERGPLFRAALVRLGDEDHVLLATFHHIVSDGWSLSVFVNELSALYRGEELPGLPIQYADWAVWQRSFLEGLEGEALARQLAWWKARLDGAPRVLELPFRPRPAVSSQRGAWRSVGISRRVADAMREVGQSEGATRFMTLLAAFEVLLHLCTGQEDLVVGTPVSGRTQVETEGLIGLFVNTLALRTDLAGVHTFRELLARVRETSLGAFVNQDLPFERLVEELQPERSLAYNPLVQVTFSLQERGSDRGLELAGLRVEPLEAGDRGEGTAKFDLALFVEETPRGVRVRLDWDADLLDHVEALRLLESYQVLLAGLAEDPRRPLWSLPVLPEGSRHQLLVEWNDTDVKVPHRPVHELFEEQVRRTPERVAVTCEGRSLTYAELNARANRIAHHLRRLGAGPEARVGISLERSLDLIAGLLGILKAGAAYLPLDRSLPAERLAFFVADGGVTLVLGPEEVRAAFASGSDADPASGAGARSLAYVLYTSGSTGVPKGVEVEHHSIVRLVRGASFADLGEDQVFLQLAPVPFDASTLEIWAPLLNGGRLVVFPPRTFSLEELGGTLAKEGISTLWLTAGLFHQMVEAQPESLRGVRQLLAGGDSLSVPHVRRVLERLEPGHRLVNGYGPTENTTFTCCWSMEVTSLPGSSVPIGRPISNTRVLLLGRNLQPVPLGVPGELYAAGEGLARGYLGRPDLTAERFVPSPLPAFPGERLYRTGDLARRLPSGEIEFLGRLDNQVKLRGFRIEPGEIEAALCSHPTIREAAVLVREDRPGDKRLVGYVAGETAVPPTPELRVFLSHKLPDYMIPGAFVVLGTLPLTPNGKVDRRALAAFEPGRLETLAAEEEAPRDEIEELLAGIWCQVLGLEAVGVNDGFFELGGHSLLATRVVSRVREVLGAELPLRALFEFPTVAGLAERLRQERVGTTAPPIVRRSREGHPPASFAQERLWFLDQLGDERAAYNVPAALTLRGALNPAALGAAVNEVIRRHEVLRTTFAEEGGRVVQVIAPALRLDLPEVDLREVEEPRREARRLARMEASRLFNLRTGPLLRVTLLRLGEDERLLLLTQHHIVSDGWSIGVLLRELSVVYEAFAAGRPSPLPELPIQYADFAIWQREWLAGEALEAQLAWWRERLKDTPPPLELPADRARPAVLSPRGGQRSAVLPIDLTDALQAFARRRGATPFMVLLAAFQALLGRISHREDLTVGSPVANRNRAETEGLLGFFVNTLVLRGDLSADPSFAELLARARETALGVYAHQDLPFERLVAELQPERDLSHTPLFQVMLIVQNLPSGARAGWELAPPVEGEGTAKFDLTLSFGASGGRWIAQAEYRRDLFDGATIDRLLGWLARLLGTAIAEPVTRVADLPLMSEAELHEVLAEWNDTTTLPAPAACLHERFEAQVDLTLEAEALIAGGERLTYAELDRRANRLARRLRRLGVGPEARVGIALERTADLPVALLATLKAGGAYVPLDPSYPRERLDLILEDAGCAVVVTPEILLGLDQEDDRRLPGSASPANLAYLIYTSGSTGRPKGVAIEHRSADALIRWAEAIYGPEDLSGVLASTSITFDLSVFELFLPLARGGRVILAANALALPDLPARDEVRLVNTVPSAIAELVRLGAVPESVRTVNLAGEPLKRVLVDRIYALPHVEAVYNLYGPSEDTTYSTWVRVPRDTGREPTIGVPLTGTRARIVDRGLRTLPIGVPGELCLAGEGLARGYLNRPDLTASSFVPDPFGGFGERMYRSGDLARRLPGGELEFLGRLDHQVKVRGFRIELGEVESALLAMAREAVVLALGEGGERRLVAFVAGEVGTAELRSSLESRLPAYMVPSSFVVLDALPLTPNGKVDRKALARIEPEHKPTAAVKHLTPIQELLAGIWSEILGCGSVGPEDHFFDLGGHSLLATQVVSRAREVFGVELPLRALFEAPALSALASRIEELRLEGLGLQAPPVVPVLREGRVPVSFAQERLWFLEQLGDEPAAYNIPIVLSLRGPLRPTALETALEEVVRRHEILRTTFTAEGGTVVQVIAPELRFSLSRIDVDDLAEVRRLAQGEAARPFDLSQGPLLRALLLRTGPEEHLLFLTMHHIVSDGWSIGVLLRELSTLYDGASLPALPVQYADFAVWQRAWLSGGVLEAQLGWWRERLAGAPAVLELPADRPRPAVRSPRGGLRSAWLSSELSQGLAELARGRGATPFMVLLSAFQALFGRLTGQTDLTVGSPVANRNRAETEGLIGFFVNTLVLRGDLTGDPTFTGLLARSREAALDSYAHQDLPFEKLVAEVQPERELSHSPVFQVMLIVQNLPSAVREGWMLMPAPDEEGTAKFDLTLIFGTSGGRLLAQAEYRRDLFDAATVDRLLGWLEVLLQGAVADPESRLSDLPLLTEPERCQVLKAWNDTGSLQPDLCLHERFEVQVDLTPDVEALVWGRERLTYVELDRRANRLARRLRRLGVGPEARVGIALERSADLVVGLLAILKAGGAYVPLDPAYPQERLALIREDAGCAVIVDRDLPRNLDEENDARLPGLALPGNLAYLIYTSGSTGRPKGVAIEHRSAAALLAWAEREFGAEELSGVLASTSITFDLSVFELFLPLARGGRVILAENALALPDLPARDEVRLINTVPSAIAELVRLGAVPESVRTVNLAGEPLKRALVDRIYALPHVERVYNLYGPSEDTTYSTFVLVPRGTGREPTIGVPIPGTRIYAVDRGLRPLPAGVPGELLLAGEGLARGYLNRPDLTAASFVPDPFGAPGARVYRTGDLVRWNADGELEFLGRIDHQVKVRGFRIELGEIETALLAHAGVRAAVVLALGESGERRLVAYVVEQAGTADLRTWLEARLPSYMVPSAFVLLDALPLTPNGKVDRKALARIEPGAEPAVGAGLRTPVEELLAGIWSEVLKRGPIASGEGFFELGGHSLLATQVVSRVREVFGVELPLRALFEAPTLAGLATRIEAARSDFRSPPIVPVPRAGELQASFAQERLWFLDRFGTDRSSYNLPTAIRLRGALDTAALAAGLREIVRRHESLRTTFAVTGGAEPQVLQVIGPAGFELPVIDLSALPRPEEEAARLAREDARRPFNLSHGPLIRAALLRAGEEEHTLLLSMHHIVSDGWSIGVLLRELTALYRRSPLADLPVQYADFAAWQRAWLRGDVLERQLGWWREHLAGVPPVLELQADRPRPPAPSGRGGRLPVGLSRNLREGVQALAQRHGATPFMVLLGAFQTLLGRLAGRDDVPVGTPIAGRSRVETEGLIGFFINTLVLRADMTGDPTFRELLGRTRESLLGAYAHQDLPFEKLVEELHPERSRAHSPLFQVMLILQNAPMHDLELPGVTAIPVVPDTGTTKFDLRLALTETAEGLEGSILYNLDLFDAATALRLAAHFETLLAAAVAGPDARISDLPLLREAEVQHLLLEWNDTRVDWNLEKPLHGWIEEQARRTPNAPALTYEGETLSYRELDERAGRLAARLHRLGAGPETRVGISAERSLELVVGLLGILKSGACYVPIDPSYPPERLSFMLEDSQEGIEQPILLTRENLVDAPELEALRPAVLAEHPAYVIYTSGSTGRPKGAVNTHRAIVNRLVWMQAEYGLTPGDVVLQKTPFSFDVSVWEFFWPLMVGARLVIARPGGHQDSAYLADLIRREGVTTLHFVPSMLQVFLEQPGVETCTSLRRVICSGEALPFELQQRFFAKLGGAAGLYNLYGPTEAAVDVTVWTCAPGGRPVVPIGRPISNLRIHIVDRALRPVPMNVPGELYIAGVGLARGYLNRPALTAERFVPDPFGAPGSRLYRSGDLCRHLPDGRIEYLGRLDHQVKIRGFRIELGEIETILCAHPSVREAVVMAREDRPGDKRLVAYLTAAREVAVPELRRHLLASLPEYMVPSAVVVLPAMPLSPNGKVDRKLLPAPETAAPAERVHVAPRTPLEEFLAGLWKAPLGLERVGIHDDFFALGGNSISGAILINQLQERIGEIVHVVVIFDAPTVERMAAYLVESYPESVARIWGRESLGEAAERLDETARAAGRMGEAEVARLRAIVTPLPPLAKDEPKNPPAVFVLSPPRSGSTLLRVMLAGHPRLFAPPELEMLNFNTLADRRAAYSGRDSFSLEGLIRAVMEVRGCGPDEATEIEEGWERDGWTVRRAYRQLQEWLGDRILIDKTPSYPLDLEVLRRAETDFEGALYIHLLRHPYGMIRSFEEARLEQVFFRYDHPFTRRELAELIWLVSQENILRFFEGVPEERKHLVRFEDLVRDPEPVLRGICGFLGLDLHPAMLRPYEERSRRMTDGLHAESRMLGDVKFHTYSGVDASTAERWREAYREDFLGLPAVRMAAALGYEVRAASSIPRRAWKPGEPRPLSFAQERLWFLGQFDPDSSFYNITNVLRFAGRLNVLALERSLDEIRRRHEVLRTVFSATSAGPFQIVTGPPAVGVPVIDLSGLPDGSRERETSRVARAEGRRPFDLASDPMLRTPLLSLGDEEHALIVAMHHIASDGWSMGVLLSELSDLYEAFDRDLPSRLPELPIQYADFAVWQRGRLSGEVLEREIAWWREALAGAPALIQLPTDRPRPAVQRFRGGQVQGFLPDDLAAGVAALSRRQGATSFMSLVAAFQALLSRISGEPEVVVGAPVAGRNWPETQDLIGFFISTLVLRGDVGGNPSYGELIARSRRAALGAFAHQEVPFEKLVEELQPQRSLTHSPVFQVMFALQNLPPRRFDLPGLEVTAHGTGGGTSKFDLNLLLAEVDGRLFGTLEYNSDLFDHSTAQRLFGSFETLLRGLVEDPGRRFLDIPLIDGAERHQMLVEWNDTEAPFPSGLCLHQLFEARAAARPEAVAALFEGRMTTYGELDRQANRLAHRLRSSGVEPGRPVAVHVERSPEMLVAVLGIHKAGGAYVPVEVGWPVDRLRYILESEGIGHIVTQTSRLEALPSVAHVVCLDEPSGLEQMPDSALEPAAGSEDPAYIIFTSGSTGRPKGVVVRHRPAVNLIHWVNTRFGVGPSDTLLFVTALSFDLSVYDIFGVLAAGGTVRIATPAELREPEALVKILLQEPVTFWDSAPAALQQLVSWLPTDPQPAAALRLAFNSGDWIPVTLPDRVRQTFPQVEFVSLGGATEATIWSNFFPVEEMASQWVSIPYGRPIENARYHVLDAALNPCPIGVPGDLYIAGGCLSDGYASAPELTAQKYLPDPFGEEPGARLYRTGDRARCWPDGNLEFLGRIDTQVKVRGFRIELGEIESVLTTHPAVREAVVLACEDTPGDQRLVAYFIPEGEAHAPIELRRFVQAKLPEYMVPSLFVPLEAWPLAATGKLDRKALPPPERAFTKPEAEAPVLPRNELERNIAEIWKEVVGLTEVGVRDNFFDIGGHSLLMARVHSRLEETLGLRVSMVDLFQYPTIAALAAHLSPSVEEAPAAVTAPRIEGRGEDVAVIGLAGRFPGARNVEELWRNLRDEVEGIRTFTEEELRASGYGDEVLDPRFVGRRGALDGPDLFDAAFFEYSPREAQIIDPQQRQFLECAWEALENAGYGAEAYRRRVGVFAGTTENTYVLNLLLNPDILRSVGRQQITISNNADYLPTRVSYKLNLRGPSLNVQTACSTSLVAVHLARLSLVRGECEIALAGGVSVKPLEVGGYLYQEGGINSPDGHTRAFDARAQGVVGGSGLGVVVLKRLEDALADGDTIHAVIRGSAVNNDGSGKPGFTAPSVEGQAAAIREAHRAAGVEPGSITYVEAHGTATPMGDPIEAAALIQAFGETGKAGTCALGSIKTNIGHLDAAAGVAGLIKTVLALENRTIPASLHFERPNPKIPLEGSPFYVAARTREWAVDGTPRRAGVSSFGIGGTNAHAVLEEAPEVPASEPSRRPARLLVLSAKTPTALENAAANLAGWLESHSEASLDDAAFTLQVGRQPLRHRRAWVCAGREEAVSVLRDTRRTLTGSAGGNPSVVFLFPGQGSQYARMGADLYEHEPVYRSALDRCCELLRPELGMDLRDLLHPPKGQRNEADLCLAQTSFTQPALFAVEYALARLWASWGVRPAAMLGHSVGEYVAACVAGVFSLEDALSLVAARGRLMQELPAGSMLGVSLPEDEVRAWIADRGKCDLSLAAVNAPRACVVSGPEGEVEAFRAALEAQGVETRPLHTSHAFHSRMMDPILEPFLERVRRINLQPPRLRYISNVSGTWITPEQATDPEYWARHVRQAVRFADGVSELLCLPDPVLLETGPGRALSTLARQHPDRKAARLVASSLSHARDRKPDVETILAALGHLWVTGVDVDWTGFRADERRRRIPLPPYPFERRSYWIGMEQGLGALLGKTRNPSPAAPSPVEEAQEPEALPAGRTSPRTPVEEAVAEVWRDLLGVDGIGVHDDFFELGGSSLMAVQLGMRLRQALEVELPVDFLFQASTVAGVAEMVSRLPPEDGRPAERPRSSCLVPLQKGDGRRPLFLVHQVGGNVYTFRALAQALGKSQTLYGLRSRGLEDGEEPLALVEQMAEHYLELVRSAQPSGPYRIGGASMGGMVAFEMAHRLRDAGETVDLLTLMDTPCGEQMPLRRLTSEEIVAGAFAGRIELAPEELRSLTPDSQISYAIDKAREAGALSEGFDEGGVRRIVRVLQGNVAALYSYQPRPWAGRMLFFRAEERRPGDPPRPEIAWIELARGGCDVLLVPGNHETMHEPPHVLTMAERLREHLG